jgi:hypothetical protein
MGPASKSGQSAQREENQITIQLRSGSLIVSQPELVLSLRRLPCGFVQVLQLLGTQSKIAQRDGNPYCLITFRQVVVAQVRVVGSGIDYPDSGYAYAAVSQGANDLLRPRSLRLVAYIYIQPRPSRCFG